MAEINNTTLTNKEKTVALYFFRFLLKFLEASVPSKPNNLPVSFHVFTLFARILISCDWRITSIAEVRSAFLAGRYAEIKTVKKPINAASKTAQPAADI